MSNIKNINLGFSCPNGRDTLNPISKDKFHCANCSKEVVDFTAKTQQELEEILSSRPSNICGIFNPSQLSKRFVKYAAATALVGSSFLVTAQNQHIIKTDSVKESCESMEDVLVGEVVAESIMYHNYDYPVPIGGMEKFYKTLMDKVNYPDSLKVDGKTFVKVTINTTGKISSAEVIKGFNKYADEEALRALKSLNYPFKVAKNNGTPVESHLIIPVYFRKNNN